MKQPRRFRRRGCLFADAQSLVLAEREFRFGGWVEVKRDSGDVHCDLEVAEELRDPTAVSRRGPAVPDPGLSANRARTSSAPRTSVTSVLPLNAAKTRPLGPFQFPWLSAVREQLTKSR